MKRRRARRYYVLKSVKPLCTCSFTADIRYTMSCIKKRDIILYNTKSARVAVFNVFFI